MLGWEGVQSRSVWVESTPVARRRVADAGMLAVRVTRHGAYSGSFSIPSPVEVGQTNPLRCLLKCVEVQVHFRPVAIGCERLLVTQFRFGRGFVSIAVSLSVMTAGLAASAVRAQTTPTESSSTSSTTSPTTSTTVPGGGSTTSSATTSNTASTTSTTTSSTTPLSTTTTSTTSTTVAGGSKAGVVAAAAPAGSVPLTGNPQCSWTNTAGVTPWGSYGWVGGGIYLVQTDTAPCVIDPQGHIRFKVGTNRRGAFAYGITCEGDVADYIRPMHIKTTIGTIAVQARCFTTASTTEMYVALIGPGNPGANLGNWQLGINRLVVPAVNTPMLLSASGIIDIDFSAPDGSVTMSSGSQTIPLPGMNGVEPKVIDGITLEISGGATIEGTTFVSPPPTQPATRVVDVDVWDGDCHY